MAFIPQEDEDSQEQGMNVLGGQPPTDTSSPEGQQSDAGSSGQPTTIGGAASQPDQPQAPAGKPKGSGFFTDIRKYVQANKPASKQLASAVSGKVEKQAGAIGQQVQQQQQQFQQRAGQAQNQLQQARQFALQQLSNAGTTGEVGAPEDISRFRQLATGERQFQVGSPLDVTKQQTQSSRLQDLAQKSGRAEGTKQLLEETYGGQPRYTAGQRSLDELILGSDASARQQLSKDVQQQAGGLDQQIRDARTGALQTASDIGQSGRVLKEDIGSGLKTQQEQVTSSIDTAVAQRKDELKTQQDQFQEALNSGTLTRDQFEAFVSPDNINRMADTAKQDKQDLLYGIGGTALDALHGEDQAKGLEYSNAGARSPGTSFSGEDGPPSQKFREMQARTQIPGNEASPHDTSFKTLSRLVDDYGVTDEQIDGALTFTPEERQAIEERSYSRDAQGRLVKDAVNENQMRAKLQRQKLEALVATLPDPTPEQLTNNIIGTINTQRRRDLGDFLTPTAASSVTAQSVVTPEQIARQKALSQLAGREGEGVLQQGDAITSPGAFDVVGAARKLGLPRFRFG